MRRTGDREPSLDTEPARPAGGRELREVLHDVGHDMATLCLLLEAAMGDPDVVGAGRDRLAPIRHQATRLLEVVRGAVTAPADAAPRAVEVREVLEQIVSLVALSSPARVSVLPGPRLWLQVNEIELWRMVTNLVDNAVRAAGQGGVVEISLVHKGSVVIQIADDGPGFRAAPGGWASLGLSIVARLAEANRCGFGLYARERGGTSARLVFPEGALRTSEAEAPC